MQTPDPMEQLETAGKIIGMITGAIGLIALIRKGWKSWREKHPTFRSTVLQSLEQIKQGQRKFDDFNAAMLRERLESLYNLYVLEMGWCPRSSKKNIALLFKLYDERFGDKADTLFPRFHAAIIELPESKDRRQEYTQ